MVQWNRIYPGCRVEGAHGDLVPNPRGNKRPRLICSSMRNANITDTIITYNNLGNIYSELDKLEQAQKCYNKAQKLCTQVRHNSSSINVDESGILYNMGVLYFKQG